MTLLLPIHQIPVVAIGGSRPDRMSRSPGHLACIESPGPGSGCLKASSCCSSVHALLICRSPFWRRTSSSGTDLAQDLAEELLAALPVRFAQLSRLLWVQRGVTGTQRPREVTDRRERE